MSKWNIPVSWEEQGILQVEAPSLEAAIEFAENQLCPGNNLPANGEYIPGSFQVDSSDLDCILKNYNSDAEPNAGQGDTCDM